MNVGALFLMLGLGWLILLLQSTIVSYITYGLPQPELLLVILAHAAIYRRGREGLTLALLFGYLMDLFSGRPFGTYLFSYVLLLLLARVLSTRMLVQARWMQLLFVGALSLVGELILVGTAFLGVQALEDLPTLTDSLSRAAINGLGAWILFPPLEWLERSFWSRRQTLL